MKYILDDIIRQKRTEVAERKSLYPVKLLERSIFFETKPLSLKKYLLRNDLQGIIAEYKRRSPSKGVINDFADVEATTLGYMQAGASALSVLTDEKWFGGKSADLETARKFNFCPILRKDFTIDPYQVVEAKSIGADVVLLIAAVLTKSEIEQLSSLAASLGMEVLLELHQADELEKVPSTDVLFGVNNRNLKTMQTDVHTSFEMLQMLPADVIKIAESGINNAETICKLKNAGYHGFLIGEHFMQHARPQLACRKLIRELRRMMPC